MRRKSPIFEGGENHWEVFLLSCEDNLKHLEKELLKRKIEKLEEKLKRGQSLNAEEAKEWIKYYWQSEEERSIRDMQEYQDYILPLLLKTANQRLVNHGLKPVTLQDITPEMLEQFKCEVDKATERSIWKLLERLAKLEFNLQGKELPEKYRIGSKDWKKHLREYAEERGFPHP